MKKEEAKQRREDKYNAACKGIEEMTGLAIIGYEEYHMLPPQSLSEEARQNSSAGILGWAQYSSKCCGVVVTE